ncbi:MAG: hypothetical protein V3T05_09960 [Myxococcota bacterium]
MSVSGSDNPFAGVGDPPAGQDPEAQLTYLRKVVDAFQSTGNPRIRPIKKQLNEALLRLGGASERGVDPEELAKTFAGEVDALRLRTYDLLLTVVNQVRATLRLKLEKGMATTERIDTERLQKALALFSRGLRKTLLATKKRDTKAHDDATQILAEAGQVLEETGHQLMDA